jgi:hypothetical protein
VRKEYVRVPDALLSKTGDLRKYLDMSHAHAKKLKPKPTKKPAAKRKPDDGRA